MLRHFADYRRTAGSLGILVRTLAVEVADHSLVVVAVVVLIGPILSENCQ